MKRSQSDYLTRRKQTKDGNTMPGVIFSIPEIMETICNKFGDVSEVRFDSHGNTYIENMAGEVEKQFSNLKELHTWVAKTNIEIEEAEAEQSKINNRINAESAGVKIPKQREEH